MIKAELSNPHRDGSIYSANVKIVIALQVTIGFNGDNFAVANEVLIEKALQDAHDELIGE